MRSRVLALFAALFLVAGLAACGSDGGDDESATTTTAKKATTTTAAETATTEGGNETTSTSGPAIEVSSEFCDAMGAVRDLDPEGLSEIKDAYGQLPDRLDDIEAAAPDELKDDVTAFKAVIEDVNSDIQAADSEADLEQNEALTKKLNDAGEDFEPVLTAFQDGCDS
jgi:hypothetical protein